MGFWFPHVLVQIQLPPSAVYIQAYAALFVIAFPPKNRNMIKCLELGKLAQLEEKLAHILLAVGSNPTLSICVFHLEITSYF